MSILTPEEQQLKSWITPVKSDLDHIIKEIRSPNFIPYLESQRNKGETDKELENRAIKDINRLYNFTLQNDKFNLNTFNKEISILITNEKNYLFEILQQGIRSAGLINLLLGDVYTKNPHTYNEIKNILTINEDIIKYIHNASFILIDMEKVANNGFNTRNTVGLHKQYGVYYTFNMTIQYNRKDPSTGFVRYEFQQVPSITLRVIFGRHGISCANLRSKQTGITQIFYADPELSHEGRRHVVRLGKLFRTAMNHENPVVGASEMIRAQQTAFGMTLAKDIHVIPHICETGTLTKTIGTPDTWDNLPLPPEEQAKILHQVCEDELVTRLRLQTNQTYVSNPKHRSNFDKFKEWFGRHWRILNHGDISRPFVFFSHGGFMKSFLNKLPETPNITDIKNYECHEIAITVNTTSYEVTDVHYIKRFDYGEGELPHVDPTADCKEDTCRNSSCWKGTRISEEKRCNLLQTEGLVYNPTINDYPAPTSSSSSSPLEEKIQSFLAKKYSSIFVFENLIIKPNGDFSGTVRLRTDVDKSDHTINLNKS
jgi:broad specificity phosphatase PhoE